MFKAVGSKIKIFAYVDMALGILLSLFLFAYCLLLAVELSDSSFLVVGFLVLFIGPILSYISALFVYGFGELVNNSAVIAKNTDTHEEEKEEYHPL